MNPTSSPADTPLYKVGESNQDKLLSYRAVPQRLWSTHSYAKPQNIDVHIRFSATSLKITRTRALHDTNPTGTCIRILCCSSTLPCGHEHHVQASKNASTSMKAGCRGHLRRGTEVTKKRSLQGQTHLTAFVSRPMTMPRPDACACSPSVPNTRSQLPNQ
jgi:hypothetical protein